MTSKKIITASLLSMAVMALTVLAVELYHSPSVHATTQTLYVDPPETILKAPGGPLFQVNVSIRDAADVAGIQFRLNWNSSVLTCTSIGMPPGHFMDPNGTEGANRNLWVISCRKGTGYAEYGVTYCDTYAAQGRGTLPRTGNGVLAVLMMNLSSSAPVQTALSFDPEDTLAGDMNGYQLPCVLQDGLVYYTPTPWIDYVARDPVAPNYDESVEVTSLITGFFPLDKALLSFTNNMVWNNVTMTRVGDIFLATIPAQSYGTTVQYKIFANDTNDNWVTSSTFSYTVGDTTLTPGDVNMDHVVDINDIIIWANAFGSRLDDPNWNPTADLVKDNVIDIFDAVLVAVNFGKTYP